DVRHGRAVALLDDNGQEDRQRLGDDPLLALQDLPRPRARDFRLQLDRPRDRHTLTLQKRAAVVHSCITPIHQGASASGVYTPSGFQSRKPPVWWARAAAICSSTSFSV